MPPATVDGRLSAGLLILALARRRGHRATVVAGDDPGPGRREPPGSRPRTTSQSPGSWYPNWLKLEPRRSHPSSTPEREQQRQALLKAEAYCRRLLQDPQASAEVRMTLAQVYEGLSGLYRSLGDVQKAEQASIRAVAEWQRLVVRMTIQSRPAAHRAADCSHSSIRTRVIYCLAAERVSPSAYPPAESRPCRLRCADGDQRSQVRFGELPGGDR